MKIRGIEADRIADRLEDRANNRPGYEFTYDRSLMRAGAAYIRLLQERVESGGLDLPVEEAAPMPPARSARTARHGSAIS